MRYEVWYVEANGDEFRTNTWSKSYAVALQEAESWNRRNDIENPNNGRVYIVKER